MKLPQLSRKKIIWIVIGVLALGGGAFAFNQSRSRQAEIKTEKVQRGSVEQIVTVSGTTKPARDIDLSFEVSGRVAQIQVAVGSKVTKGQTLISLSAADLRARVSEAFANEQGAAARLAELKRGSRPEELYVAEAKVASAEQALVDAKDNQVKVTTQGDVELQNLYDAVPALLYSAYNNVDNAVRNQVDDFFADDNFNPQLTFTSADSQAETDVEYQRKKLETTLATFKTLVDQQAADTTGRLAALTTSTGYVAEVRTFLNRLNDTVNGPVGLSSSTLAIYKADLATARANTNTSITAVSAQQQAIAAKNATNSTARAAAAAKIRDAETALTLAQRELSLTRAGTSAEVIRGQEATVAQLRAATAYQQSQVAKTVLVAPFAGVITKIQPDAGDVVAVNVPVISLLGEGKFTVEVNIAETDIAKVAIGDEAIATLDAYGPDVQFKATVASIDLAETLVEGVAAYKTTLQFIEEDERIRSGLTANIQIMADRRDNVLFVSSRQVTTRDGKHYVQLAKKQADGKVATSEVEITLGLRGSDGRIEILSGLQEGDEIVVQ